MWFMNTNHAHSQVELLGSEYDHKMPITWRLPEQDVMNKLDLDALGSTVSEALGQQEDCLKDVITKALQLMWSSELPMECMADIGQSWSKRNKDIITLITRNKDCFKQIYCIIVYGISGMLPSRQLDNILLDTLKDMSISGRLDDIKANMKQLQQQDDTLLVTTSRMVHSQTLEEILLDIFAAQLSSGELDGILVGVFVEELHSGKFDGIISNVTAQLGEEEVKFKFRSLFFLFITRNVLLNHWRACKSLLYCVADFSSSLYFSYHNDGKQF